MLNDDDWLQRVLTVQDYTSVNVKTGYQRIISKLFGQLPTPAHQWLRCSGG